MNLQKKINQNVIEKHIIDLGFISEGTIHGIFLRQDLPTEQYLHIKKGARVMLLKNYRENIENNIYELMYANGDVGIITDYDTDSNIVYVTLNNGEIVRIKKVQIPNYTYEITKDAQGKIIYIELKEIGWFYQFPLAYAYATTIHKAQGRTIENVHLVLGERGCFAYGQLYTAISRVKKLKNLTLDRAINMLEVMNDPQVIDFYKNTFPMLP